MVYNNHTAVLQTLLYADIFSFPMTKDELWYYLIATDPMPKRQFQSALYGPDIAKKDGYYMLRGREYLVGKRKKAKKISIRKIKKAKRIAAFLAFLPTIKCIGVSGSLAMENARKDDDIDFFIITSPHTLFITRFLIQCFLAIQGVRRTPNSRHVTNTVCVNMLLDGSNLTLPVMRRDLYTAHEVAQMKVVFSKDQTHEKFLFANSWIKRFLPNSLDIRILQYYDFKKKSNSPNSLSQYLSIFFVPLELLARRLQTWYMKRHRTTETVTNTLLAFHPKDYKSYVLQEYAKRLHKYSL